ncbi:hypothetical protein, partial [Neisseria meningitidis]|uniref:hypothetical protein n=1 Tax=Neisseria meningitidis TaxID=487 RepID=UPI0039802D91
MCVFIGKTETRRRHSRSGGNLEPNTVKIYPKRQQSFHRHSRAGGNLGLSAQKLVGKNGFFRFYVLDSHFRGND